jgi:hypothetical protein
VDISSSEPTERVIRRGMLMVSWWIHQYRSTASAGLNQGRLTPSVLPVLALTIISSDSVEFAVRS